MLPPYVAHRPVPAAGRHERTNPAAQTVEHPLQASASAPSAYPLPNQACQTHHSKRICSVGFLGLVPGRPLHVWNQIQTANIPLQSYKTDHWIHRPERVGGQACAGCAEGRRAPPAGPRPAGPSRRPRPPRIASADPGGRGGESADVSTDFTIR